MCDLVLVDVVQVEVFRAVTTCTIVKHCEASYQLSESAEKDKLLVVIVIIEEEVNYAVNYQNQQWQLIFCYFTCFDDHLCLYLGMELLL